MTDLKLVSSNKSSSGLSSSSGDGTIGDMEARVVKLEDALVTIREMLIRIETKLDFKADAAVAVEISTKLDAKASAAEVAGLSGALKDNPDTWKVITMIFLIGGLMLGGQIVSAFVPTLRTATPQPIVTPAPPHAP